jgi:hypothetical protein
MVSTEHFLRLPREYLLNIHVQNMHVQNMLGLVGPENVLDFLSEYF